ncbi:50S ribosomal protein L18 [Helcococcus kunzii]|uniref:Large ribosomal subunit protein uL18 n=1 Tax=Helcococcus kunzii ATCC 51366 TaxID=883114 RepID=H3NP52_9FIRM|nr:50S ribosomal protein L18 [Helcococcus kunzii]EHR33514.1 ribosomal protein L18 [Helcococcus kunzii ATCC 51366]MCT1795776.1 50S ribosomal protein L18 [Helcococcus kunzii]MCT1989355.1 50S ribosomal protein L18 [Helcococcus kunzii]QZO75725.1 50S ribosomal protein L18 [Helcococcus kunzii]
MAKINKKSNRLARHLRVRKNLSGTPEKPRLNMYKSNANIYAQIIDDVNGVTLVSASTLDKELKGDHVGANIESAKKVGELVAKRALEKGIDTVVFDRSGYIYHGKVKELAESAREAGLKF